MWAIISLFLCVSAVKCFWLRLGRSVIYRTDSSAQEPFRCGNAAPLDARVRYLASISSSCNASGPALSGDRYEEAERVYDGQ